MDGRFSIGMDDGEWEWGWHLCKEVLVLSFQHILCSLIVRSLSSFTKTNYSFGFPLRDVSLAPLFLLSN